MDSKKFPPSSKEIFEYLDRHVVGQEYAKEVLSLAVYKHYIRIYNNLPNQNSQAQEQKASSQSAPGSTNLHNKQHQLKLKKSNILLLGATGTGKTLLAETIAKYLDVPFAICDCSTLTETGYVGKDIESVIERLLENANYVVDRAQMGIVFLDQVDTIRATPGIYRDVGGKGVHEGMLNMLEGRIVDVPERNSLRKLQVDTTDILFIALGTYSCLAATSADVTNTSPSIERDNMELLQQVGDLIDFGMIPQFIGKFSVFVPLHNLDRNMLARILTEPENALIPQHQKFFSENEVELTFDMRAVKVIASLTMKRHRKTGARGLVTIMESLLSEPYWELSIKNIVSVHITEQCVKGLEKPQYVRRPLRKKNLL